MGVKHILQTALLLSLLIILLTAGWWFGPAGKGAMSGFLFTADQQAQRLLHSGDAAAAAVRYRDPRWQAAAWYRAGDFKQAAGLYAGLDGTQAVYNQANTLVMLGKYEDAVKRYDAALTLQAGWQAASDNREIALHRAERVKQEGGEGTGGKLGADEIRFDLGKSDRQGQQETLEDGGQAGDAELRETWLRRMQTSPGDFLRARFAYQQARSGEQP